MRRAWICGVLLGAPLALGIGYIGVQYALYQTLPWQRSAGMASAILAEASPASPDQPVSAAAQPDSNATPYSASARSADPSRTPAARASRTPTVQPASAARPAHGRLQNVSFQSALLHDQRPLIVYLPPDYDASRQRYPVLYLLHGAPGSYSDWVRAAGIDQTLDALISVGRIPPMIAVMPDGNGGLLGDTEWANSADGSVRIEDYLTQEIVPFIDRQFRTLPSAADRAIGGLSTGGFGAANITLHHPELFSYALCLSGNFMAAKTWTGQDVWAGDDRAKAYNSPILYAPHASGVQRLHFYLTSGDQDNADIAEQTRQFAAVLEQLKTPHTMQFFPGKHAWSFWQTHIVDALEYLAQVMPPSHGATPLVGAPSPGRQPS